MIIDAKAALKDPDAPPSVVWEAALSMWGDDAATWEPDTYRLELKRRGIVPTDALMSKLMAAQTIVNTRAWTVDHDVFFAFALACHGIPASAEAYHIPEVPQLCVAVAEIERLTGMQITPEMGFDPTAVDPAVAVLLFDQGYLLAPDELQFAQEELDEKHHGAGVDVGNLKEAWRRLRRLPVEELEKKLADAPETAQNIQLQRLADCRLAVLAVEAVRSRYVSRPPV